MKCLTVNTSHNETCSFVRETCFLLTRSFLIGSGLSGPNFPRLTAEMDRLRTDLTKSCLGKILEERTVLYEVQEETLLLLSYL